MNISVRAIENAVHEILHPIKSEFEKVQAELASEIEALKTKVQAELTTEIADLKTKVAELEAKLTPPPSAQ